MASKLWLDLARKKVFSSSSSYSLLCNNVYMRSKKSSIRSEKAAAAAVIWRKYFSSSASAAPSRPGTQSSFPILVLPNPKDNTKEEDWECLKTTDDDDYDVGVVINRLTRKKLQQSDANWVGSSFGWLAIMNHSDCGFYLTNRISSSSSSALSPEIIPLPSIETLPSVSHIDKTGKTVNHIITHHFIRKIVYYENYEPSEFARTNICRLSLSSPPPNNNNNKCAVMVIHRPHFELAFCRLGGGGGDSSSWTPIESKKDQYGDCDFIDVMYSIKDQLFYALAAGGQIEAWDLTSASLPIKKKDIKIDLVVPDFPKEIVDLKTLCADNVVEYLVESGRDIFWIHRFRARRNDCYKRRCYNKCHTTVRFEVYKLDFESGKGEYVDNIGSTALFVGKNESFALSVPDFPDLNPNSIYFADDDHCLERYPSEHKTCVANDIGIYNLEDHTAQTLADIKKINHQFPYYQFPMWVAPSPPNPS